MMQNVFTRTKGSGANLSDSAISIARPLGLGCYFAWVFMLFYMTKAYPAIEELRDILYLNQILSTLALVAGLGICALIAWRKPEFTFPNALIISASLVMLVGSLCIVANRIDPFGYVEYVVWISGLFTGFGSSVLLASWGVVFMSSTARIRLVESALAFLGALFNCFILNFLPEAFTLLLVMAVPVASCALVLFTRKRTQTLSFTPLKTEDRTQVRRLVMRASVAALVFGLVAGFMDVLSGYRIFSVGEYYDAALIGIAGICALSIFLITTFVKRDALIVCYRFVVFLAILGCMATSLMDNGNTYPNAIIAGSYISYQIIMFGLCGTFTKKYHFVPLLCFCGGFATLYFGESVGLGIGMVASTYIPDSLTILLAITVFLSACLLFVYLFLFTERDFIDNHFSFSFLDAAGDTNTAAADRVNKNKFYADFAEEFGLTSRELDVFALVIQGRSNSRIQEELFISSGTVSTHINHIYRKCNVSNKQELLDIVEERQGAL